MAAIVKSWVRIPCPTCRERRVFVLIERWTLECETCGARQRLGLDMLGERPSARTPAPHRVLLA